MIEATTEPCGYCYAGRSEECCTPTGLAMDRVHVNRGGRVTQIETARPLLADALNRHATDIPKFMRENGL